MSTRSSLTVVSGTTITSAWGNGVRDHLVPSGTTDDLSSNGQVALNTTSKRLVGRLSGANYPFAGAMPRVKVTTSSVFALGATITAAASWDTEQYDTDSLFSTGTSTDNLYASHTGAWLVTYQVFFSSSGSAVTKQAWVSLNGASYFALQSLATTSGVYLSGAAEVPMTAGQYVSLNLYTDGSGVTALNANSYFGMRYLGPT